jgi:hypothetical protein
MMSSRNFKMTLKIWDRCKEIERIERIIPFVRPCNFYGLSYEMINFVFDTYPMRPISRKIFFYLQKHFFYLKYFKKEETVKDI